MTPDQEIRAKAALAASNLVPRGAPLENVLSACDVLASFIENGWEAAHATFATYTGNGSESDEPEPEPTGLRPVTLIEPTTSPFAPPPVAVVRARQEPKPDADILPSEVSKPVPPQQTKAMHLIDATRKTRARSIMGQASIAKVRAHMDNLMTEAQDGGLWDFRVATPQGDVATLGQHLEDLYAAKGFASASDAKA